MRASLSLLQSPIFRFSIYMHDPYHDRDIGGEKKNLVIERKIVFKISILKYALVCIVYFFSFFFFFLFNTILQF